MRYVILRDDDTNALTPVECLERLYRPFLDRGLPVNLATIPNVSTSTRLPDGRLEGFITAGRPAHVLREHAGELACAGSITPGGSSKGLRGASSPLRENDSECSETLPIGSNSELVNYLTSNAGYEVVHHGFRHDYFEFDQLSADEAASRLEQGRRHLRDAGFGESKTFVAPYDKLSRDSMQEVARRFPVISTGWFELGRIPRPWLPRYLFKKVVNTPHWRIGKTTLLSHPGCLLSCHRELGSMLQNVINAVQGSTLTVLVTHWWEYFREGEADENFIRVLHQTAEYLASDPNIRVIRFSEVADRQTGM